ncbi:MAG: prohibitin family protein [Candidatus Sumerlaeaceae bacterium]|nr:prohibitin family protein [Candidatus Sumerlaeaceae bacterium]
MPRPTPREYVVSSGAPRHAGKLVFVIILLVIVVAAARSCYHIVPPGNRGVLITLGKVSPNALPEGFNFKIPLISRVENIEIRQMRADGTAECFSSDLQTLRVSFNVLYRIPADKVVELFQQYAGRPYTNLVEPRLQETMKQVTARYRAEDFVKNREKAKQEITDRLKEVVGDLLTISDLTIANIDLSDQLEAAIEQKVVREQEALAKKFELESATKMGEITLVTARADAEAVRIRGEALKASPEVIEYEIARKWDGKAPQSVVLTTGGANVLLPLK